MLSARTSILLCAFTLAMLAHAGSTRFGVALSAQQKRQFIDALVSTSLDDLEAKLPRKLRRLHVFKPYFSMYELASTAYSLVIESPGDAHRWRALAKLDSYADGSSRWVTRTPAKRLCRGIHICSTIVRGSARCQITIGETTPRHLTMRCSQPLAGVRPHFTL